MTVVEIIKEIETLPAEEKETVLRSLLQAAPGKKKLSPNELVALADRMVAADDPAEADRLEVEILAGFYGR